MLLDRPFTQSQAVFVQELEVFVMSDSYGDPQWIPNCDGRQIATRAGPTKETASLNLTFTAIVTS